jgi:hypothetical protein
LRPRRGGEGAWAFDSLHRRGPARIGAPYAGPGNKFRPMLAETGPTPRRFAPQEWPALASLGIDVTFINTVRTERFDQVLALKSLLPTLSAAAKGDEIPRSVGRLGD